MGDAIGHDVAVRLAIAELSERTFAMTRQCLDPHEVLVDAAGSPVVARVDAVTEPGAYHVYFSLREVPYHCVVVLRPNDASALELSWVYMQQALSVSLLIRSEHLHPDEITRRVGIEPTRAQAKGSRRRSGLGAAFKIHWWDFEAMPDTPGWFEEKLRTLLARVESSTAAIAALVPECTVRVAIGYKGWCGNCQLGELWIDPPAVQRIAALGATLWVDLYAYGPPMGEGEPGEGKPE